MHRSPACVRFEMEDRPSGLGDHYRSPMENQNPYEPPTSSNSVSRKSVLTRSHLTVLAFTAVSVLIALLYFPVTLRYVFETGDIRNTWVGLLEHVCLLGIAVFLLFVEFMGGARIKRFLPIPLGLLLMYTLLIAFGCFRTISFFQYSLTSILTRIFEQPVLAFSWLMCPIVWYYSMLCYTRHYTIRKLSNGEPSDAPKDRASRLENGNSTSGPR